MTKFLQSLIKIIFIGIVCLKTEVFCRTQYLSVPPLPYYQNNEYYLSDFVPPHRNLVPAFYPEKNIPPSPPLPSISYQNLNYFSPPQLFHQNKNYQPPQPLNQKNVNEIVKTPQSAHISQMIMYQSPPLLNVGRPVANFQISQFQTKEESTFRPPPNSQQEIKIHTSNNIQKEENSHPYYVDEYNKNYHDEDYIDNYNDEESHDTNPCEIHSPYRFFQPSIDFNNPESIRQQALCNPYFQTHFVNAVYNLKTPITLLPSRFPPRVEQIIERIQNYFSTYTQQGIQRPLNQTLPIKTTTPPPSTTISESEMPVTVQVTDLEKTNTTNENQEPGETNIVPPEEPNDTPVSNLEQAPEKEEVPTIQAGKEISLTTEVLPESNHDSQTFTLQESENTNNVPIMPETTIADDSIVTETSLQQMDKMPEEILPNKATQNNETLERKLSQLNDTTITEKALVSSLEPEPVTVSMGASENVSENTSAENSVALETTTSSLKEPSSFAIEFTSSSEQDPVTSSTPTPDLYMMSTETISTSSDSEKSTSESTSDSTSDRTSVSIGDRISDSTSDSTSDRTSVSIGDRTSDSTSDRTSVSIGDSTSDRTSVSIGDSTSESTTEEFNQSSTTNEIFHNVTDKNG